MADTIFARLQSTTGSIYHPVTQQNNHVKLSRESLHQARSRMQWAYIPCTLVATITLCFSTLGLKCHLTEAKIPVLPVNLQTVYFQPATPVTTPHNWTEGSIYLTGLQLQQPPPTSRSPAKSPVHNTGLLPGSWSKNKPVQCILYVKSV